MRHQVEMIAHGPAGVVHYREDADSHAFDWEFGGGDVLLSIYVPAPEEWDARIPWAAGRRAEVLERLARAVCRQQFPPARFEIHERWIHVCEPRPPWRVVGDWLARLRRGPGAR